MKSLSILCVRKRYKCHLNAPLKKFLHYGKLSASTAAAAAAVTTSNKKLTWRNKLSMNNIINQFSHLKIFLTKKAEKKKNKTKLSENQKSTIVLNNYFQRGSRKFILIQTHFYFLILQPGKNKKKKKKQKKLMV